MNKRCPFILPVLVVYKCRLEGSQTFRTLAPQLHGQGLSTELLVYDNSPVPQEIPVGTEIRIVYQHDYANSALAGAYNFALKVALEHDTQWLLLLDQDSDLPINFLQVLESLVLRHSHDENVVAITPRIWSRQHLVSPRRVTFTRTKAVGVRFQGPCPFEVTAFNTCTAIRVKFVHEIGGFSLDYPLDCLDHWFFRRVYAGGRKVVISDLDVKHNLSVSDFRNNISLERYCSIISAETRFFVTEKSLPERFTYILRLLARALKHLVILRKPRFASVTVRAAMQVPLGRLAMRGET